MAVNQLAFLAGGTSSLLRPAGDMKGLASGQSGTWATGFEQDPPGEGSGHLQKVDH